MGIRTVNWYSGDGQEVYGGDGQEVYGGGDDIVVARNLCLTKTQPWWGVTLSVVPWHGFVIYDYICISVHVRATLGSALKRWHLYVEHGQLDISPVLWQPSLILCLDPKYLECFIPYFTPQSMMEAQLKQSVSFMLSSNVVGIQNCW